MKWLGQHIVDFIARFRSDVYLEDLTTTTDTSVLVVDANDKVCKNTTTLGGDLTDIVAGAGMTGASLSGPIPTLNVIGGTGITVNADEIIITPEQETITSVLNAGLIVGGTDTSNLDFSDDGQIKVVLEGDTQFNLNQGNIMPQVTNTIDLGSDEYEFKDAWFDGTVTSDAFSGPLTGNASGSSGSCTGNAATSTKIASITNTDIVVLAGAQTLTGTKTLNSFKGTGATTVTNILDEDAMGTNSATALATQQSIKAYVDAVPVKAYFTFRGYGTSDGANYEMSEILSEADGRAPFEHDTSTGSDGLTAQTPKTFIKAGAFVMPYSGEIRKFTGWATSAGGGTVSIGIFKATLTDDSATNVTPALLVNTDITASGNNDPRNFTEASLSAAFSAGDLIYSAVKGSVDNKAWFLGSTLEVEWD